MRRGYDIDEDKDKPDYDIYPEAPERDVTVVMVLVLTHFHQL